MTNNITIRTAEFRDIKKIIDNLRDKDKEEAFNLGVRPYDSLKYSYKSSLYSKTALINGMPAAMWGVIGTLTSEKGHPYLVTTKLVETISPLRFARIYKQEVNEMLKIFQKLNGLVDHDYNEAQRLLKLNNFDLIGPVHAGPQDKLFYQYQYE
jgi:uncharacterized pyridoxal phosphate-containing UPF0001 family protein